MAKKPAKSPITKALKMSAVKSSNIESIGYNELTKELHVHFLNGGKYKFLDVPEREHALLMAAKSHGKHFQERIRYGSFQFEKY